ncbi:GDP-6-deoxy-D-mannose reductase [Oceanobacillus picturae]|uniref:GDP-6-deoxy-D-mannose reductase n=1 Tax=Oceanobacillus picturae TaxID=171693 RepID=W9ADY1_9BACI|nr:NAD-dependent epimerase/dehydratase family protein [Oceanobacillus picturae]CDO03678.1 GDP-6-deoxy-D-mannose reductase [Oceanobacillus picturae]
MKRVLITGVNSYIGTSFEKWVSQYKDMYSIDFISLKNDGWKKESFSDYDVIVHVAAIVHVKGIDKSKYFEVNRDLTVELALKAKEEGVKQFIFLSTMGVYGTETGYINKDTKPVPKTPYAQSKYEAEQLLLEIQSSTFYVAVLRPPLVYGKGCPGNYTRLANMAIKLPVFPNLENERSMIFINNLSEFIKILTDNNQSGIYFPQNKDYVNTTELVRLIAKAHRREIKTSKVFNWAVAVGIKMSGTLRKVFGTFVYDKKISRLRTGLINGKEVDYETVSFEESIILTEKNVGD